MDLFTIVCWPESQHLMDLEGFGDNAYLVNDEKGMDEFGSSAYFVRKDWLDAMTETGKTGK